MPVAPCRPPRRCHHGRMSRIVTASSRVVSLVLVSLLTLSGLVGCDSGKPEAAVPARSATATSAPAPAAGTARAKQLIAAGALVLDVREQGEWDEGHLAQARLIPLATVDQRLAEIEQAAGGKDKPIVVYCKTGGRAGHAKDALEAAGFTNVVNGGGYRALSAP